MDSVVETTPEGHTIRMTTQAHIDELKENLREMDKIEVACFKSNPENALNNAFLHDDITMTVMTKDENVMAIFGSGKKEEPYIWMLGSPEVEAYSKDFLLHCRKWVWALTELYGQVSNYIHSENFVCLKWLEWCGASFSEPFSIDDQTFIKFTINK